MTEPFSLQVVVDCASPHELADWWAETLDWEVEPQEESFIRSMIDQGLASVEETTQHKGSLVWASGAAIRPAHSTGQGQPRVLFQQVPESKTCKNRVHLDLRPGPAGTVDLDSIRQQLIERGATEISRGRQGPHEWVTFADPRGQRVLRLAQSVSREPNSATSRCRGLGPTAYILDNQSLGAESPHQQCEPGPLSRTEPHEKPAAPKDMPQKQGVHHEGRGEHRDSRPFLVIKTSKEVLVQTDDRIQLE